MNWSGDEDSLKDFFQHLNTNHKDMLIVWISWKKHPLSWPEYRYRQRKVITKTYFKPVEWNRNSPVDSCHHDPWLIHPKDNLSEFEKILPIKKILKNKPKWLETDLYIEVTMKILLKGRIQEVTEMERGIDEG